MSKLTAKERARQKKRKRKNRYSIKRLVNIIAAILLLAQFILSAVFIGKLDKLDMLPMKYFSLIFGAIMFVFVLCGMLSFSRRGHIFAKVVSLIVCIILGGGSFYLSKTIDTMNALEKNSSIITGDYVLLIRTNSKITSVSGINGTKVGILKASDASFRDTAVKTLEDIKEQDYILTPGRYVGLAETEVDEEPFEEKMERLTKELGSLLQES